MTTLRLVDGDNSLQLYPNPSIEIETLDLGFPDIRDDVEEFPGSDGLLDSTAYFSGRVVAVELSLFDTPLALADQIRSFTHPSARPYLFIGEDEWAGERRLRVRTGQLTFSRPKGLPTVGNLQVQWRAPDGVVEDANEQTATLPAFTTAAVTGLTFPRTFPAAWPTTMNASAQTFTMAGSVPVHWTARLYGPCTGPRLTLDTTGDVLAFPTLTLAAGDYLELDSRNHTARLNGSADASRLQYLDFTRSSWWRLRPGTNTVRYNPLSVTAGAQAILYWRQAWL